jgi:hypothetical protein
MANDHRKDRDRAQPVDEWLVGMNIVGRFDRGFGEQHAESPFARCARHRRGYWIPLGWQIGAYSWFLRLSASK